MGLRICDVHQVDDVMGTANRTVMDTADTLVTAALEPVLSELENVLTQGAPGGRQAISELPETHRLAVSLHCCKELSDDEIG
jgi:hypothetical protein